MKSSVVLAAGVLIALISVTGPSRAIAENVEGPADDFRCHITQEMNRILDTVREARANVDLSAFDSSAKLYQLEYDADKIVEFVRQSVAFEQYTGSLRGARGTLLSVAGNALDQSLLLANLLSDAGYDARIVRATLDDEAARALLRQMKHARPGNTSAHITEELVTNLAKLAGQELTPAELQEKMESAPNPQADPDYKSVEETTLFLQRSLSEAGISLEPTDRTWLLIEESRDYFWVQYKQLAADGWTDVHPAFVDAPPADMPEPAEFISGAIPEDLLHRVRLQFFIERSSGGKLEVIPISGAWERPTANLVDVPISFFVLPTGISSDTWLEGTILEALGDSVIFATVFNGSMMPEASLFDLKGNLVDPMAASGNIASAASGIFATMGDRFGGAAEATGAELPTLTAHWIQITLIAPGGSETTYRRTTLDRIGPSARALGKPPEHLPTASSEEALSLLSAHTIMIATGRTPFSLAAKRTFDWMLRAEPMYRQLMERVAAKTHDETEAPELKPVADLPTYWPGHLSLFSIFDRADALVGSHRIYRSEPGIVLHVQGPRSTATSFEMVDIVTNARRAVTVQDNMPRLDPQTAILAGVWDTAKEGALLNPGEEVKNTQTAFKQAAAEDRSLVTLRPGEPISGVELAPDIETLVQSDLSRGFAVVLPRSQKVLEDAAWWRVHPETGETVGQAMAGKGAELVEKKTLIGQIALLVSAAALLYGADQCDQAYQRCNSLRVRSIRECSHRYQCCMGLGFAGTIAGLFLAATASIALDMSLSFAPNVCD